VFGSDKYVAYKIGVFPSAERKVGIADLNIPKRFKEMRFLEFVGFKDQSEGMEKLKHHKIDFLVKSGSRENEYWVSETSPKGSVVEQIFTGSLGSATSSNRGKKMAIQGFQVKFIDWFFPGILAMNMMFSALYGVGYVVVLYRKNGVLKRFKATPLTAVEYLSSQMLSRIFVIMFTTVIVFVGGQLVFSLNVRGSSIDALIVFLLGSLSLTSLGLIIASRGTSEEFASGILNFLSWPMMFLSEVWFSLEDAPQWLIYVAKIFPLTHIITAARKVMNDGLSLADAAPELTILALMTVVFLGVGASLFSWTK